jgi:hypothetical protein
VALKSSRSETPVRLASAEFKRGPRADAAANWARCVPLDRRWPGKRSPPWQSRLIDDLRDQRRGAGGVDDMSVAHSQLWVTKREFQARFSKSVPGAVATGSNTQVRERAIRAPVQRVVRSRPDCSARFKTSELEFPSQPVGKANEIFVAHSASCG